MFEKVVCKSRNIITYVDDVDSDIFDDFGTFGVSAVKSASGRAYPYVFCKEKGRRGKIFTLHRLIAARKYGTVTSKNVVDHIDGNPLNNLRDNLRVCTQSENMCNTTKRDDSIYKGYWFDVHRKKWVASISFQKKAYRKRFSTEKEAREYVSNLRKLLHKEFANFG